MARAFKEQLDEFDDLRDTQVILAGLIEILPELPQLEVFEEHLHAREEEMMQELRGELKQLDTSDIAGWIHKTEKTFDIDSDENLKSQILDTVDDAFLITRQRLGWIDLSRPATIHRVRVSFKAFRYMVEIVQPLLRAFPPGNLKQMNDYQTLMGNIQDTEVFALTLADFMQNASLPDLEAVNRYYEKRRAETISAFVEAMDQLHTFWRPAPDQPFPWEESSIAL
jgi:CHAD domain-containing protein